MQNRRQFLGSVSLPTLGLPALASGFGLSSLARAAALAAELPDGEEPGESFWGDIARAFTVDRSLVNLNNGGVSPSPAWVQEAMKRHLDYSNGAPAYTMWRVLEPQREAVRERVAAQWGVSPDEIAFTRNASEGLQTCQLGFDLAPGDEVLTTDQDYPRMITTFRQRERRDGIVLRQFPIPTPSEDPAAIVRLFEEHISERTRLILVCHMINITGQILPVREVTALGRERGIPVIVDGAHALAHFDFTLSELDCDYYASSLHKWLFAPHGTGLLFVRRDRIESLWPLMAAAERQDSDIRKFEEIGTHPAANYLAIAEALTFHQTLGPARKERRLISLRDHWAERLLQHERIRLNTSLAPGMACGIANVACEGLDAQLLCDWLWSEHGILTTAIRHDACPGLRISPSVYTTKEELDRFCEAIEHALEHGLPS